MAVEGSRKRVERNVYICVFIENTYDSIQEPVCSSCNQSEPVDKPESHKQKKFLTSHIRDSAEIQTMLSELFSGDSSLVLVIRESPVTIIARPGIKSIVQCKPVEPSYRIASKEEEKAQLREQTYHRTKKKLKNFRKGHTLHFQEEDPEDDSA